MPDFAPFETVKVGDAKITYLADGGGLCDPLALFPKSNEVAWSIYHAQLNDKDELVTSVGGFLVEIGTRRVIVDAGIGPVKRELRAGVYSGGRLLQSLERAGVPRPAVTDVVFTHLHVDHCGWATCGSTGRRELTFPNAAYRMSRVEWEYWQDRTDPTGPDGDEILGHIASHLDLVEDGDEIAPGLRVLSTPGHTPGHISLEVASNGERAILLGDVVCGPVHLLEPDWHVVYDADRTQARESRRRIFHELSEPHTIGAGSHFADSAFGRYVPTGLGQMWVGLGQQLARPA